MKDKLDFLLWNLPERCVPLRGSAGSTGAIRPMERGQGDGT